MKINGVKVRNEEYLNSIDREDKISEQLLRALFDYCKTDEEKIALTLRNAYMVETLLKIDSNYKNAGNIEKKKCFKYMEYITTTKDINVRQKEKINK